MSTPISRPYIFHIALLADWEAARKVGSYRRSTGDRSLDDVGFIHCSTEEQWPGTLERHYGDRDDPLVLLTIDGGRVPAEIRIEEGFPHIYGPLPTAAVVRIARLR